ncbi:MAG TPA: ricin-type beta-trefoil lectin domain protein [Mycobacteriales bacterium]
MGHSRTLRRLATLAPVALLLASATAAVVWWPRSVEAADGCPAEAPATLTGYVPDRAASAMTRLTCTGGVAVYADAQVRALPPERTAWVQPFAAALWQHLLRSYGACAVPRKPAAPIGPDCERFGSPKPLVVMLAYGTPGDGDITTRFDEVSGFRNTLWAGSIDWTDTAPVRDALVRQGCRLAEAAGQGVQGAPAVPLWGDAFASLCTFDFYRAAGRSDDLLRTFKAYTAATQRAGSLHARWFRDWMVPLWVESSGTQPFGTLFGLLSRDLPTEAANGGRSVRFGRALTLGELVHFTSAVVGQDLSTRAAAVFGPAFSRASLDEARRDWPNLTYPALPCVSGADPCPAAEIVTPGPQVSKVRTKVALKIPATLPAGGAVQYAAGGLPAGLALDAASGIIAGTPTTPGPALVTVAAGGQGANPGRVTFLWEIVEWRGSLRTADGRCADNALSGTANGNPVRAWTCNGTDAQSWTGRSGAMLVQGRCLVVAGTAAAGAQVATGDCDGSAAQNWRLQDGTVRHLSSKLCLSVPAGIGQATLAACPATRWTLAETTTT